MANGMSQPFARALALFDDCVAMPPAERDATLAELAQRDPDTHRALWMLLEADGALQEAGDHDLLPRASLEVLPTRAGAPAPSRTDADLRIGSRLGPWRIERLLDSGGMGTVYEAWRDDGQYQQRVALKCIRTELTSPRLVDSFRRERDALAALEHPGIATLFDGGVEPDGHPWFAMRYVQGAQIDTWCDARMAGLRQRVELLVQVCDALAYAHQRRVLHQDIKPSNLMVTGTGQVQVLDFGLTASLAATDSLPRLAASDGYTAPEALAGAMPAMTMDVWSLGTLMYRLLCGVLPRVSQPLLSTVVAREDDDTPTMSRLAARVAATEAQARGFASAAALARGLAGDLDAIAARCIAHDPDERYTSVAALRDDLQAWLQLRPVHARGGGGLYRTRRFLQRHRLAAGLAGTVVVVVLAGAGVVATQHHRAAQEAAATLALSQVFEETLGTATLSGLGDTAMSSRALLLDTERRVRTVVGTGHPDVLARGLSILARNQVLVGDYARATALAEEAASLRDGNAAANAATLAALLNLQGKPADARRVAGDALAALGGTQDNAEARTQLIAELALAHWDMAEHARARELLDQALAQPASPPAIRAQLLTLRGQWSTRLMRFAEADAELRQAIALATPDHPLVANEARNYLAQNLLVQERTDEGRTIIEALLADYRHRLGNTHPLVGRTLRALANLQCSGGDLDGCATSIDEAERIVRRHYGEQHPEYAEVLRVRSLLHVFGRGDPAEGVALLRQAIAMLEAAYPDHHYTVMRARFMLARRLLISPPAAAPDVRKRSLAEPIRLLESVMEHFALARLPVLPLHRYTLAQALLQRSDPGDLARARQLLVENQSTLRAYPASSSMHAFNAYLLADVVRRTGDLEQADAMLAALMPALQAQQASTNSRFALRDVLLLRATIAAERGKPKEARDWLVQTVRHMETAFGPDHVGVGRMRERLATFDRTGEATPP